MIRRATIHDVYPLTVLFREWIREVRDHAKVDTPNDFDHMAAVLSSPQSFVVTKVDRKKIVGFGQGTIYQDMLGEMVVFVDAVYVSTRNRNSGIGKALYKAVLAFGKTRGCTRADTTVPIKYNEDLLTKAGFSPVSKTYSTIIKGE